MPQTTRFRPVSASIFVCGSCEDRIREPQTRLVDKSSFLSSSRGDHFVHPFVFIFCLVAKGLLRILAPKPSSSIPAYEPRFALLIGPAGRDMTFLIFSPHYTEKVTL